MGVQEIDRWFRPSSKFDLGQSRLVPAGNGSRSRRGSNTDAENAIRTWLRSHQHVQYELVELGLRARESEIGSRLLNKTVGRKFLGEEAPAGIRQWCLARAAELWDSRPKIAEETRWVGRSDRRRAGGPPFIRRRNSAKPCETRQPCGSGTTNDSRARRTVNGRSRSGRSARRRPFVPSRNSGRHR